MKDAGYWPCSVWTRTREWQRYSALSLQELCKRSSISAKRCGMWLMQYFPLRFTNYVQAIPVLSDFKATHMCPTGSITMQYSVYRVKRITLVERNSMQVTKGTWHMHERYEALFPPPPHKSLGMTLILTFSFTKLDWTCRSIQYETELLLCRPHY